MKDIHYSLIVALPPIVLVWVFCIVLLCITRKNNAQRDRSKQWVVTNIFSEIIEKKTKDRAQTKWLLKDIDLTDEKEILSKVFNALMWLSITLICGTAIVFWQILLLDVTYDCDENDNTKDCFEYKLWNTKAWSRDPIDCKSAPVQNGTLEVVCYKIVFNFGLASGASFGAFKISMAILNVATALMLMVNKPKTICRIKTIMVFVYICSITAIIAIQATSLRVSFKSGNLVILLQMIVMMVIVVNFVFLIPWKDLIAFKARDNEQATGLDNLAAIVP